MDAETLSRRWLLAAVLYFLISVCIGTYMARAAARAVLVHSHAALLAGCRWG